MSQTGHESIFASRCLRSGIYIMLSDFIENLMACVLPRTESENRGGFGELKNLNPTVEQLIPS